MIRIFVYIVYIVFFSSCISRQSQNSLVPVIDVEKSIASAKDFYNLSDIAERIEYIPLELTAESLIGRVLRVFFASEDIFILTSDNLFRFDKNGKFINIIGKQGRGPGEFLRGFHIAVDTTKQHIYVRSAGITNIIVYDYDGNHIQTIERSRPSMSPIYFLPETQSLAEMGATFVLANNPESFFISVTDTDNNEIYRKDFLLSSMLSSGQQASVQFSSFQSSNGLLLLDVMSDTIFNYHHSKLSPYLLLNLGRYKAPLDVIISAANANRGIPDNYINVINIVSETPQYLFLQLLQGENWYLLRYNKHNQEYVTYKIKKEEGRLAELFNNDIDGGLPVVFSAFPTYNELALIIHPYDMKEELTVEYLSKSEAKEPRAKELLKDLVQSLGDEDNPVIMKIILK